MKAIIAVNTLGFIGKDGKLPWHCPADLQYFKVVTYGKSLLVGYNTLKTLPKLRGREIVVDKRDDLILDVDWCIGGRKTYEKYAPYFTELHISSIGDITIGDTTFPDLSNLNPDCKIIEHRFLI